MPPLARANFSPNTTVIESLNQLIGSYPRDPVLYYQRAEVLLEEGKYDPAIQDLEKVLSIDPKAYEVRHLLADVYLDNLQSRKALETMEMTVQLYPDSTRSKLKLSEFQHILKRYPDARNTLNSILASEPFNPDAFFMMGMVLKETGDTAEAIVQFQKATREDPNLIDAWINLGQLLEATNDPEAGRYLDAGLEVQPNNIPLIHAKAQFLARNYQEEAAKETYRRLIRLNPDYTEAYYDLGLLYLDQDSLAKAADHFDIAIKTNPRFQRAYFYLGLTKELLESFEDAKHYYSQATTLNPKDQDAIEGLERIDAMTQDVQ